MVVTSDAAKRATAVFASVQYLARSIGAMPLSHRRDAVAADVDGCSFERPVILLGCGADEDLGAGLELAPVAGNEGHNYRLWCHDDLLLSVFVFERDFLARHGRYHLPHGGVGHGTVRHQVPWPESHLRISCYEISLCLPTQVPCCVIRTKVRLRRSPDLSLYST
jgi:hypothetical protein